MAGRSGRVASATVSEVDELMPIMALTPILEAARDIERDRVLLPLERRLETAMALAFARQERVFMRGFVNARRIWPVQESIAPRDWEPWFAAAIASTQGMM